ncbi:hypothetical protein D3C72_1333460 [compost metagenome]
MDGADTVDHFADASGKLASAQLPLAAELDEAAAHFGNDAHLDCRHESCDQAQPEILNENEEERGERLAAEKGRLHEGVAGKAAERLNLVLHHAGDFSALDPFEMGGWEPQNLVYELEADTPQKSFAEATLEGIDIIFEKTVDDDKRKEGQAERHQHRHAVELKPGE